MIANKFLGYPADNRHLAAVDTQTRIICTCSPNRRAITIRIIDNQLPGVGAVVRLPVNVKLLAAGVDQSAVDRQLCALTKHQTAILRTIDSQIPIDGYGALNHIVLAAQSRLSSCEQGTRSAEIGIRYNVTIC